MSVRYIKKNKAVMALPAAAVRDPTDQNIVILYVMRRTVAAGGAEPLRVLLALPFTGS